MKPGQSLLVLETDFLGRAYEVVHGLPAGVELMELLPSAGGATLLLTGPLEALRAAIDVRGVSSSDLIEHVPESVLTAYLGLENPPLQEQLLIFESPRAGALFKGAVALSDRGFLPFDLRLQRGGAKVQGYLFATGPKIDFDPSVLESRGVWTRILSPSDQIRALFETAPH